METQQKHVETLPLSHDDWELIAELIISTDLGESVQLNQDLEVRLSQTDKHEFSLLISYKGLDALHFCWKEVEGCFDIDHRIVNPRFRGNGYATKMLQFLMKRCERLAQEQNQRQLFMMDTHKESIVRLARKVDMKLTKGQAHYEQFQKNPSRFRVTDDFTIVGPEGYALNLRMTKIIEPVSTEVQEVIHEERGKIIQLFSAHTGAIAA